MENSKTLRVAKWDNIKFFLIVGVVVLHMLNMHVSGSADVKKIMNFMHLYTMPTFFLVTGLFAKRAIRTNNFGRALSFLILYFFMKFLRFGVRFFLIGQSSERFFSESGVAWFAFAVFVYLLLTMFLKRFDRRYVIVLAVVMGCMSGYDNSFGDSFVIARMFTFYPFFLLGYYLDADQIVQVTRRPAVKIAAAAVVIAVALLCLRYGDLMYGNIQLLKGRVPYSELKYFPRYGGLMRLMQYMVSSALAFSLIALTPERRGVCSVFGQRTIGVYALHYACVDIFYKGLNGKELLMNLWPEHYNLLAIVGGILIALVLSWKPFSTFVNAVITPPLAKSEEKE